MGKYNGAPRSSSRLHFNQRRFSNTTMAKVSLSLLSAAERLEMRTGSERVIAWG